MHVRLQDILSGTVQQSGIVGQHVACATLMTYGIQYKDHMEISLYSQVQ